MDISSPNPPNNVTVVKVKKPFWKNRKTMAWLLVSLAAVIIGCWWGWTATHPKTDDVTITTAPVTKGTLSKTVAATGKVVANFEVEIKAKGSGKILTMPYDVGDVVQQGALLVQLDPLDESRQVSEAAANLSGLESRATQARVNMQVAQRNLGTDIARARADLNAAQAKYNDAQTKASRLQSLASQRYISQEEAETGSTTASQARTDLSNAQTRLQELQTQQLSLEAQAQDVAFNNAQARAQRVAVATSMQRLSETKVYAPIAGVVTTRTGQIGQIVSSGISNVGGGTAIMTLADLSHIFVLASVDESDVGQVREGQVVHITADAFPGQQFEGRVVRIAPKGVVESNVVTFEVKIEVVGANKQLLKPEMTTNVEIVLQEKKGVLVIPVEAVTMTPSGKTTVQVVNKNDKDKPHRREVVTGLANDSEIEIVRGLALNDVVITGNGGPAQSKWRRDGQQGQGQSGQGANRRGQMMMMRGMGGGGGRR